MRINTKLLMASSAVFLAVIGLCLTFLATETANYFQFPSIVTASLFFQILGAFSFAFALLNWMAKGNTVWKSFIPFSCRK